MKDAVLHLEGYLPNGGGTVNLSPMDLGVDGSGGFSDNWRWGKLRVTLNAGLPNFTNANASITVSLIDSVDGLVFTQTNPLIQASFPGVVTNGTAAGYVDCPLPPGLRGPVGVSMVAPAANLLDVNGNPVLVSIDWLND